MGFSLSGIVDDLLGTSDPLGTKANQQAADIQYRANQADLRTQKEFFNILQESKAPVLEAQNYAIDLLRRVGAGEADIPRSPGFDYRLGEGLRNLETQAAAAGKFNSGQRYISQQDYASGLTSQDTSQNLNRLLNLAGYSTNQVSNVNPLLQQSANNQGFAQQGLSAGRLNQFTQDQNFTNMLLNNAATFGGYFAGGSNQQQPYTGFFDGGSSYRQPGGLTYDFGV